MFAKREDMPDGGPTPWFKWLARGVGTVGGAFAIMMGVWACVTVTPLCLVAGITQILLGFLVIMFESPCCCQCLDFVTVAARFADARPFWQKCPLYIIPSILPMALCPGASTILGSGCIFATGVLYGIMAVGRKAPRDEMASKARLDGDNQQDNQQVNLVITAPGPVPGTQFSGTTQFSPQQFSQFPR